MARCDECGFDWDNPKERLVTELSSFGAAYELCLTRLLPGEHPAVLAQRPRPGVWSALEYTAHMRDVVAFYAARIDLVLREDQPQLAALDFDRLADERHYNDENPSTVLLELSRASAMTSDTLAHLSSHQWCQAGLGSDGGQRTVLMLARRLVHDGHHHLLDIGRVLSNVREQTQRDLPPMDGASGIGRPTIA